MKFQSLFVTSLASPSLLIGVLGEAQARLDARQELPAVWPPPQEISSLGCAVNLRRDVTIVTGKAADTPTIDLLKEIVSSAGGKSTVAQESTGKGTQIVIGSDSDNSAAASAAEALAGKSAKGLADDGYVLASGKVDKQPTIVLNGVDTRGTYYAAQTLRQLVGASHGAPGVKVRDWPLMSIRGSIEGFYGVPWSHQARLDQYVFYGKHKMNTYVYTPKDDKLLRDKWRDVYTGEDLKLIKELIATANGNHVDFTFALSPGNDICFSSDEDFDATVKKLDQIRDLGVTSFYIALDDIPLKFHCDSDNKKWNNGDGIQWIADAHAFYLNRVQTDYVEKNKLLDLQTVPTNYAGSGPDAYKTEFGKKLNSKIRVQWTGEGVFSPNVSVESVQRADKTYNTDNLYIWDNFPVNDNMPGRLFLNPLTERATDLYKYLLGFTSNPMVQSYASMIALGNYGDYMWNAPAYDATESWKAVIAELAGKDQNVHRALAAFVDLNLSWPYRKPTENATELRADIKAFWAARNGEGSNNNGGKALRKRLALIKSLPQALPPMAMKPFAKEVAPWSTVAMQWATACQHLIAMLDALDKGDKAEATNEFDAAQEWVKKTKEKTVSGLDKNGDVTPNYITPTTGDTVFDKFVADATAIYNKK